MLTEQTQSLYARENTQNKISTWRVSNFRDTDNCLYGSSPTPSLLAPINITLPQPCEPKSYQMLLLSGTILRK